jgi:hypothetical protein
MRICTFEWDPGTRLWTLYARHNPTERIDIPVAGSKRPKRIVTREEAARLISALPVADQAIWATAFYAGLRRGELQAIRRCDINLATCLISVKRGWDQYEGVIDAKSQAGERELPLLALLRDILDEYLLRTGRKDDDLLFGRTRKEAFVASTIRNRAQEAWKAAGLKPMTLHECRHTFASLLIDSGANPKAIQQFMGHANIQTTFDIYGHLLPGSHDEVRSRMDSYLAKESHSLVHRHGLTGAPLVHEPIREDQSPVDSDHQDPGKRLHKAKLKEIARSAGAVLEIPLRGFERFKELITEGLISASNKQFPADFCTCSSLTGPWQFFKDLSPGIRKEKKKPGC